ncbi:MAG TPA: TIGR03986 family CRISPR-associated RAMP protein [Cyanobacteria bacterium UBA11149]|nr:TIGR03986 family CRISPR-associated RAMP protein [Cyanobacteria bacterium UBA11367]HBE58550.1 TIGR03986 family CRISPR-associated RAMP protein [Cyanobacteria bacterium UBA11366]HBK64779.1 TIGR03986 family CRISPR-associated RAMP protein [Cyanobacteria bacterium UBA11166]HBR76514.1 TIGR03986 family CRISPR-associated RAMP protein [Cyanobacteria bacterium UBA11159]HBS67884.1 TIGR03986 family CRISPR-associated RAMP protein [Cyanobacteria bacterium UBA11153]HBW90077.1 TIGR03986 family CRISPR-associ
MNHKHIDKISDNSRRAIAPYNFVELPEKVVEAELPLPEGDRYHAHKDVELPRHTGRIECTLTTESPLYTRCGWHPDDFAEYGEEAFQKLPYEIKSKRASFFINPKTEKPTIPGSSIRGMLRTLVEIVTFSKIDRVSDEHRLFFRAVASNPDKESWGKEYKNHVEPKKVKAGYLKKDSEGWYIQPAKTEQGATFAWVGETSLNLPNLKIFNNDKYEPQYRSVSYRNVAVDNKDRAKRLFAHNVELPDTHPKKGVLVTSGNMKQGNEPSPRRNHCVVFDESNSTSSKLRLDDKAIEHYRNALTDFQKTAPFDKDWGILEENRPVFYCPPEKGKNIVGFFGQSPNFRIPYSPEGNGHATTVVDFIPKDLRKLDSIDLADAIFGWVKKESKDDKLPQGFDKQRAGRVFITDALYQKNQNGIWYENEPLTPQILSEPKPSYFPHYMVQSNVDKLELKHYASQPVAETVIRGHKLYWHKGSDPNFKPPQPKKVIGSTKKVEVSDVEVSDTQTTLIKPINKGVTFKFDIHFENLSQVELGVLLWVLDIAQDNRYRLKLGMGKPLGLGAVKIEHKLYESDRQKRYTKLFNDDGNDWETAETLKNNSEYKQCFENYMLEKLQQTGNFEDICRIQMLLAMLSWPGLQDVELARYMEIKRDIAKPHIGQPAKRTDTIVNEHKERPVLPNPLDVMGIKIECDRPSPPQNSISQPTQLFLEGQEIEAKIVDIKVQEGKKLKTIITYKIEGSECLAKEEIYKRTVSLVSNDIVKVVIVKTQGKSIRTVKLI